MKVTMLYTKRFCFDGFKVKEYVKDETYDLADWDARVVIASGAGKREDL